MEKKFLTIRKRTRTHAPQEGSEGDKKTGAVSKQRNEQSAGQHHEAGGCGERCRRERARAHRQAGPGAGWRAGLGVVKGPGEISVGVSAEKFSDLKLPQSISTQVEYGPCF